MEALIDWAFLRREQLIQEDKKKGVNIYSV